MPFDGIEDLRAFWESRQSGQALAVRLNGSADNKWPDSQKRALTYCISNDFHANKPAVVAALATAAREWSAAADVSFLYLFSYDTSCNAGNNNVVFDVRPSTSSSYDGRAFFPLDSRGSRTLFLSNLAFQPTLPGGLNGVVRHEFGHILGFVHEAIDVNGTCGDPSSRRLTAPDRTSVMITRQCTSGDYSKLSPFDVAGAISLYGQPLWRNTLWSPNFSDAEGWQNYDFHWRTIQYGDIDLDGKDDVCGSASTAFVCSVSGGLSFQSLRSWTAEYSYSTGWGAHPSYWSTIRLVDVNGDRAADVCGRAGAGIHCAVSNRSSFPEPKYWSSDFSDVQGWNSHPSHWETIQFADVNGDRLNDVCGRGSSGIYCGLSTGDSFTPMTRWIEAFTDAGQWNTQPSYWRTIRFPDLNGDGKADVCGRASGGLYCALSDGANSFDSPRYWATAYSDAAAWNLDSYWETLQFIDLNGDGHDDVCGRNGSGMLCSLSTGFSFDAERYWTTEFSNAGGWNASPSYWRTIAFPDLNRDGNADICGRGSLGLRCALSNGFTAFGSTVVRTTAPSDTSYVATSPTYYETIRYPDLDGDKDADLCYRARDGLRCSN